MSPSAAAWNTWTGQQLQKRGFRTVEVFGSEKGKVRAVFAR